MKRYVAFFVALSLTVLAGIAVLAAPPTRTAKAAEPARPKLVVVLVVDQMRADYVDKFRGQWTGGLKRLVEEGAWFRNAAYPYAATETCVGHATIATGALPATHGIVGNSWWDRDTQKIVNCTADAGAKNMGYAGASVKGGDSATRLAVPTFAAQLRLQSGGTTRVVALSLKARAAILLAGKRADAMIWFDGESGAWATSDAYGAAAFAEEYAKAHPAREDYGKTWALSLPASAYLYDEAATGALPPAGWGLTFPHPLRGKADSTGPDAAFYTEWEASPYGDMALVRMGEAAVDALRLGQSSGTDFLGISFSSLDYVGHAFGPHSREIQDILACLDRDLGELFAYLDEKVGRGNYVVALSADHGVAPIPKDTKKTGGDAGWLKVSEVQESVEKALEPLNFPKPAVARIAGSEIYFSPGVYERLKNDPAAMGAVLQAIRSVPGMAQVYRAEELANRAATSDPTRNAEAAGFFPGRSGDLLIVPKPYWPLDFSAPGKTRDYGTTHGTLHPYDQRVPVLFMGWGIVRGQFRNSATPADIAPTLAALCGVKLAAHDGRVLTEALKNSAGAASPRWPVAKSGHTAPVLP